MVFGPFLVFLDLFGLFRVRVGPFFSVSISNHTNSSRRIDPRYPEAFPNSFDFFICFVTLKIESENMKSEN